MYPTKRAPYAGIHVEQQIRGLRNIGLNIDLILVDRLQKGMVSYVGLSRRIRSKILGSQPDIVHVMYGGIMADIITRVVNDRPTVVTFHGSDLLGEHLSGVARKLLSAYGVFSSWRAARRASRIVTVATVLRDALPNDIDRSKIQVIPCGIDLERFKPLNRQECRQQLGWHSDSFHVLFPTNSGDPVKRFDLAQGAVLALNSSGIRAEIHQLRGIENSLVPVWLNASDVLLLSSLHEGSPTVVKEALACNVPVVSVDVGDVRERIREVDGCYIAAPDPSDLAAKLTLVCSGRRRVAGRVRMQELSLERIALKLKNIYQDLM